MAQGPNRDSDIDIENIDLEEDREDLHLKPSLFVNTGTFLLHINLIIILSLMVLSRI
jgi:hypothetical protein